MKTKNTKQKKTIIFLLLLGVVLNFCFAGATEQALKVDISSDKNIYKQGEPIDIKLRITNSQEKNIFIMTLARQMSFNMARFKFNVIFKVYNEKGENVYPFGGSGFEPVYSEYPSIKKLKPYESNERKFLIAYHWPPEKNRSEKSKGIWCLADESTLRDIYSAQQFALTKLPKPRRLPCWTELPWIVDQEPGKYRVIAIYSTKVSEKDSSYTITLISNQLPIEVVK